MRWWERDDPWLDLRRCFCAIPFHTFLSSLRRGLGLFMIFITVGASNGLEEGVKADMGNRASKTARFCGASRPACLTRDTHVAVALN